VPLYRLEEPSPALTAPVVVAAFDGWIDAAGAASSAADQLANDGELLATFEGDVLFDYRSRRPTLDVVDGLMAEIHRDIDESVVGGAEARQRGIALDGQGEVAGLHPCRRMEPIEHPPIGGLSIIELGRLDDLPDPGQSGIVHDPAERAFADRALTD